MAKAPWEDYQQSSNEEDGPWADFAPTKTTQAPAPEAYIGEDGRRYIKSVDKPSTPSFGDMFTKEVDDFFGTAEAAANLVTGGIAQGTGLIGGGAEYLRKKIAGEPTTFEKEYADSIQRQTFEPRGESGQEKVAAVGKFFNDVGITLAGHGAIGPTLASGKPVTQPKKPPTANKTVEAIRAAQEAKKAETVAGEDPAVIELAKQRAAEMQARAQARPITVDSSGNAALDATKGPFVREDPMTRMVRELGGEPLPKETVTPDNAITRMVEDLTSGKTPETRAAQAAVDARNEALVADTQLAAGKLMDERARTEALAQEAAARQQMENAPVYSPEHLRMVEEQTRLAEEQAAAQRQAEAQAAIEQRQRDLESGVEQARAQDEAITDVSHRRMGPSDEVRSRQVANAPRPFQFSQAGLGKKQGGAINLWQTPDPNSILGRLAKADWTKVNEAYKAFVGSLRGIDIHNKDVLNEVRDAIEIAHPGALNFARQELKAAGYPENVLEKVKNIETALHEYNLAKGFEDLPWEIKKKINLASRAIAFIDQQKAKINAELDAMGGDYKALSHKEKLRFRKLWRELAGLEDAENNLGLVPADFEILKNPRSARELEYVAEHINLDTIEQALPTPSKNTAANVVSIADRFKSQRGSINLWSTPDPDSIVGRISRAFKEEGVDLIDQNLIPPNPELQSVIDTAKAEGSKGDGKFLKNFQSGSTSVAMKTRSPLLLAGSRIGQNALKMTDIHVRNYVMPAENAIRKLSKEDIQTLHEVMLEESRNREMTDRSILADHLSPDQLIAYDLIRKMQENQLEQVNAARKEKGLEPVDAHEAYLASRWQGDFRRPIYQKVGEDGKKLVWYLASNTKMGLERETKNLLKYAKENGIENLVVDASLDHQVHTSRNRTDLETAYSTMIDLLGRDDPAVKAMAELVEQAKAAEAYNAFGTKKHFENKAGIRGFVGDRPWKNPQKEAIAAFEEQFQQSKNAYSWAFTQKAVDGITKLASDPDLVKMQPKNVAFLRDYAKTLMGMSETKLAKALDDSFRSTGISPKLIQQGVGNLKSYFILTKLGASVGNMVVNTLQTANIPSYLSQMVGAGYRGNPITSIATGMFGGIMMATAHYTPKTSRAMIPDGFLREAVDYAEANGVTARSIVDEAPVGSSKTIAGKAVRAIGHTLSGPETLARSVAFMSYAKMLESSGKFTKEQWPQMFQLAEEYTNKSMVDYRQTEHAMIYGKGGTIGKALNVLQTYPMSFWNQYSFMAREAAKGNPWGLLTMLPTHYLLAGVAGIPAAEALDKLYKLVKDNLLSTETWAELNESPFWRDPKAWLIDQMGQGYYGKLSVDTGINWTSRLGAPGPESMVMAPGGAAVELFEQGLAVGKAALDPTNSTKWAQAGMKTVPVALQGLLEQSGAMKDHTYVVKPETGERVYQKNTDLAAREGQYSRSPEEEKIRNFGLRSQKEVMTRDMMYSASREVKLGQQKAAELPDRIYDAARRGDQQKANTLAALYMSISKEPNAGATLEEALKRATIAEYTTTEQKAALSIKESVNKAIAYARARKALESVK